MANVTLTIEAEHNELLDVVQQLFGLAAVSWPRQTASRTQDWSEEEVRAFMSQLKPDAAKIVKKIAARPNSYPWDELDADLGVSGNARAGRMSSVGHAMNQFPEKKPILHRDYQQRVYTMDPEVAKMIANED